MKKLVISSIRAYQRVLSPDKGIFRRSSHQTCAFYPTCSEYAVAVIEKNGVLIGIFRSIVRIFRCHPWQKEHIDLP